jgi:hypothetical protein
MLPTLPAKFVRGTEKVDLDCTESFLEFENVLLGWYLTDWKQVLHKYFPEPVNSAMVLPEHNCSLAANFERAIDLFVRKILNEVRLGIASIFTWPLAATMFSIRRNSR